MRGAQFFKAMSGEKRWSSEWAVRRVARLSRRFSVEITVGPGGMTCEWSPTTPGQLTQSERRRYREVRDACISEFAGQLGGSVLVIET